MSGYTRKQIRFYAMIKKSKRLDELPHPQIYTVKDTCAVLKISHSHCYSMIRAGVLKPIKMGRKTLIPIEQINQLLNAPSLGA